METWPEVEARLREAGATESQIAHARWTYFQANMSYDPEFSTLPSATQLDIAHEFLATDSFSQLPQTDRLGLWNSFAETPLVQNTARENRSELRSLFTHAPGASDVVRAPVEPTPLPPDEDSSILGEFTSGIKTGIGSTAGMFTDAAGSIAESFGDQGLAQNLYQRADDLAVGAAEQAPGARVRSIQDIQGLDDLLAWVARGAGEQVPILGAIGGAAALGGLALPAAAGAMGAAGTAGLANVGMAAGGGLAGIGLETGSIGQDIRRTTGESDPGAAITGGVIAGLLEALPVVRLLTRNPAGKAVKSAVMKKLKAMGATSLQEAVTEFGQTYVEQTFVDEAAKRKGQLEKVKLTTPEGREETLWEAINAAALGGVIGGGMGMGMGMRPSPSPAKPTDKKLPPTDKMLPVDEAPAPTETIPREQMEQRIAAVPDVLKQGANARYIYEWAEGARSIDDTAGPLSAEVGLPVEQVKAMILGQPAAPVEEEAFADKVPLVAEAQADLEAMSQVPKNLIGSKIPNQLGTPFTQHPGTAPARQEAEVEPSFSVEPPFETKERQGEAVPADVAPPNVEAILKGATITDDAGSPFDMDEVRSSAVGADVKPTTAGAVFQFPGAKPVHMLSVPRIEASTEEQGQKLEREGRVIAGSYSEIHGDAVIQLAEGQAGPTTKPHEVVHWIFRNMMSEEQQAVQIKEWKTEEEFAKEYARQVVAGKPTGIFAQIKEWVLQLAESMGWKPRGAAQRDITQLRKGQMDKFKVQEPGSADPAAEVGAKAPWYYSALTKMIKETPQKKWKSGKELLGYLKNTPKVKNEEIRWTGLEAFLNEAEDTVTKDQVLGVLDEGAIVVEEQMNVRGKSYYTVMRHVDNRDGSGRGYLPVNEFETNEEALEWMENQPDVDETTWSGTSKYYISIGTDTEHSPKHAHYQEPGGKNYREILLTLKKPKGSRAFESPPGHYEESNIINAIRVNDRKGPNGEKVLFIEEMQGDWEAAGRKKGYGSPDPRIDKMRSFQKKDMRRELSPSEEKEYSELWDALYKEKGENTRTLGLDDFFKKYGGDVAPDTPYKGNTWTLLGMRRMMAYAAEHGYDAISWTSGVQQSKRWSGELRKVVNIIEWGPSDFSQDINGPKDIIHVGGSGKKIDQHFEFFVDRKTGQIDRSYQDFAEGKNLVEVFGKTVAQRILKEESGELRDDDIVVGGQGLVKYYDRDMPKILEKEFKKAGLKVEQVPMDFDGTVESVPYATIPKELASDIRRNKQPVFEIKDTSEKKDGVAPQEVKEKSVIGSKIVSDEEKMAKAKTEQHESISKWRGEVDLAEQNSSTRQWNRDQLVAEAMGEEIRGEGRLARKLDVVDRGKRQFGAKFNEGNKALLHMRDREVDPKLWDETVAKLPDKLRERLERYRDDTVGSNPKMQGLLKDFGKDIDRMTKIAEPEAEENVGGLGIIEKGLENYVARFWKKTKNEGAKLFNAAFSRDTDRSKHRKYPMAVLRMLEAYEKGEEMPELAVESITEAMGRVETEVASVHAAKVLVKEMQEKKGIIYDQKHLNELKALGIPMVKLEHQAFDEQGASGWATKDIAKLLNNATMPSKLKGMPFFDIITKFNAGLKKVLLMTGFFHHQAFARSYFLGTKGSGPDKARFIKAMNEGMENLRSFNPLLQEGIRAGLTIGRQQDWDASGNSILLDKLEKHGLGGAALKHMRDFQKWQARTLFQRFGAGLKVQAYLIEMKHAMKKNEKLAEPRPQEQLAKEVAGLINADFGGLNLKRMGRSPTYQHLFQIAALAPDWTESNVQTMVKALMGAVPAKLENIKAPKKLAGVIGSKPLKGRIRDDPTTGKAWSAWVPTQEEARLYQQFWGGVVAKAALITVALKLALAGLDDEDEMEKLANAWDEGPSKLRWLDVDVTVLSKLAADAFGYEHSGKRHYASVFGHFKDPIKFVLRPKTSAKHKGSPLVGRLAADFFTGSDWRDKPFTTWEELLGIDEKGYDTKGQAKGGKHTGKLTKWGKGKGDADWAIMPSWMAYEAAGSLPIFAQAMLHYGLGEIDEWEALARAAGVSSSSSSRSAYDSAEDKVREAVQTRDALRSGPNRDSKKYKEFIAKPLNRKLAGLGVSRAAAVKQINTWERLIAKISTQKQTKVTEKRIKDLQDRITRREEQWLRFYRSKVGRGNDGNK